jgi:hypothetical protein
METVFGSLDTIHVFCLGFALALALGFEFVNGFHDTANAVATVIYTHSLSVRHILMISESRRPFSSSLPWVCR